MAAKTPRGPRLVYSSDRGSICPECHRPVSACVCRERRTVEAAEGPVRVRRERAGRKGKEVTLIRGVPLGPVELADLGRALKRSCGSGGTVKDGVIEIQGNHVERVVEALVARGFEVRRG
jgi:translation initiation factor 1